MGTYNPKCLLLGEHFTFLYTIWTYTYTITENSTRFEVSLTRFAKNLHDLKFEKDVEFIE